MFLFKLAILNIGRNPRRSLITTLAVAVGLAALIFMWGFQDGTANQMRRNVINLFTGYVQIHANGFQKESKAELTLPDRLKLIEKVQSQSDVVAIAQRVRTEALVGTSEKSRGVLLIGVDPAQENKTSELHKHMLSGQYLKDSKTRELILGDKLAEKLGLKVGDKAVVMTQAIDGTLAGYSYPIRGIFHTGSQQVDELTVFIGIASAQDLLGIGEEIHEVLIRLSGLNQISKFVDHVKSLIDTNTYEVLPWNKVVPEPEMWLTWYDAIMRTILIVVMVLIGVGIMNTVLMSVFERTREIGVMMALGTSPKQITTLILLETLVLEIIGIIVGILGGYALVAYFGQVGISFSGLESALSQSYVSSVTYTQVEFHHVIESIITLVLIASFISLYPAWKAGRMEPIKAIYHS